MMVEYPPPPQIIVENSLSEKSSAKPILSGTARLRLALGLLLLLLLDLLLLRLVLLVELALVCLPLLLRLGQDFEESLEPRLLGALEVLLEARGAGSDSILGEALLGNQEFHQAVEIGLVPLEIALGVVRLPDIGREEQVPCVFEWPVFGDRVFFLGVILHGLDDFLESAMLTNQLQGRIWPNLGNRVEVVAAE